MVDPELLEGLERAVAALPDNLPLRLHLGSLLLEAGRPADALEQCAAVLLHVPDHRDALDLAARATMAAEPPRWANDRTERGRPGAAAESRGSAGAAGRSPLGAVRAPAREPVDRPVHGPAAEAAPGVPLPPGERLAGDERASPGERTPSGERAPLGGREWQAERFPVIERYPITERPPSGQRFPSGPSSGPSGPSLAGAPPAAAEPPSSPAASREEPLERADVEVDQETGEGAGETADEGTGARSQLEVAPDVRTQAAALIWQFGLELEDPGVTLADVGGTASVKQWLSGSVLDVPVEEQTSRRRLNRAMRGGLLEYGPPGCGKTFMARAIAGELGVSFLAVDLVRVLELRPGEGQHSIHEIFQAARIGAPCLLFLDQLDALGDGPLSRRPPAGRGVVEQLVAELQAVSDEQQAVIVVAASESPWDVDPLLRQPGRLDRRLLVLPPDREAREAIVAGALGDHQVSEGLNLAALAGRTEGYSAADLILLSETAIEVATEGSLAGGGSDRPVTMDDFNHALLRVRASPPAWLALARDFVLYAGHGGVYDDLLAYLRVRV
jgi:ATP-dependent 26S proteasome regulatory subunit